MATNLRTIKPTSFYSPKPYLSPLQRLNLPLLLKTFEPEDSKPKVTAKVKRNIGAKKAKLSKEVSRKISLKQTDNNSVGVSKNLSNNPIGSDLKDTGNVQMNTKQITLQKQKIRGVKTTKFFKARVAKQMKLRGVLGQDLVVNVRRSPRKQLRTSTHFDASEKDSVSLITPKKSKVNLNFGSEAKTPPPTYQNEAFESDDDIVEPSPSSKKVAGARKPLTPAFIRECFVSLERTNYNVQSHTTAKLQTTAVSEPLKKASASIQKVEKSFFKEENFAMQNKNQDDTSEDSNTEMEDRSSSLTPSKRFRFQFDDESRSSFSSTMAERVVEPIDLDSFLPEKYRN